MISLIKKTLASLMLIVVALLLMGIGPLESGPFAPSYRISYCFTYEVNPGDTIWDIANRFYKLQDKQDIREFVFDINQFNNLGFGHRISIGQVIKIPIYKRN